MFLLQSCLKSDYKKNTRTVRSPKMKIVKVIETINEGDALHMKFLFVVS